MNKKRTNITTASLRSASSKRSRRNTTNANNTQSITTSTSHKQHTRRDHNSQKNNKKPIGSASEKAFFCKGCNKEFRLYSTVQMFINRHLDRNEKCLKFFPQCICKKIFYDTKRLRAHQSRKNKNSECYKQLSQELTDSKFNSSEVIIQPARKSSHVPSDIPSNLNSLLSSQDNSL